MAEEIWFHWAPTERSTLTANETSNERSRTEDDVAEEIWFHWAPTERRPRIQREGLVPGRWSRDRLWRPPYVCLAVSPSLAWGLSGRMDRERQIASWDLWQVWTNEQSGYEELYFDRSDEKQLDIKEIRVYERIYKRNVWYVGSRSHGEH